MSIRRCVAALAITALVLGQATPGSARETTQGEEAGLAIAAATINIVYVPVKALVAFGGLVVGALVGLSTGGDTRSAYAVWVPAAGGTYMLRAANIDGSEPIEFFGGD